VRSTTLVGEDAIATYLRMSTEHLRQLIESAAFPALTKPDGALLTTYCAIDQWLLDEAGRQRAEKARRASADL